MVAQAKNAKTSSDEAEAAYEKLYAAFQKMEALFRERGRQSQLLQETREARRQLLLDVANMPQGESGSRWFLKKWRRWIGDESSESIESLRTDLRFIWREESIAISQLVLDSWLAWRSPDAIHSRESGRQDEAAESGSQDERVAAFGGVGVAPRLFAHQTKAEAKSFYRHSLVRCSLADGRLIFNRIDVRTMLIQGVFERFDHFKICENNECLAPFFIARRTDQIVCNAESCKAEKQREYARSWWNQNRGKTEEPVETRTKKGRVDNGTRKAR
jgi:hypothetical protein